MADGSERAVSITNALSAQTASLQADFPGSVTSQRNLLIGECFSSVEHHPLPLFYLCVDSVGKAVLTSGRFPLGRCRTEKNSLSQRR
jgi:hypothetical protein